jgi:hypothetical protein
MKAIARKCRQWALYIAQAWRITTPTCIVSA